MAPYGVYLVNRNAGFVNLGTDHDTSAFAVESIRRWWDIVGKPLMDINTVVNLISSTITEKGLEVKCVVDTNTYYFVTVPYIKKRYNEYRGTATKYLNRYNAMSTLAWRKNESVISGLYARLLKLRLIDYHHTIRDVRKSRLLTI